MSPLAKGHGVPKNGVIYVKFGVTGGRGLVQAIKNDLLALARKRRHCKCGNAEEGGQGVFLLHTATLNRVVGCVAQSFYRKIPGNVKANIRVFFGNPGVVQVSNYP